MKTSSKYLWLVLFFGLIYVCFLVLKPFAIDILTGAVLAYIFYPVYKWLRKTTGRKRLSALIVSLLIILLVTVPLVFVIRALYDEANIAYIRIKQRMVQAPELIFSCDDGSALCRVWSYFTGALGDSALRSYFNSGLNRVASQLISESSKFIFSLPAKFLGAFITIFVMFYCLLDGPEMISSFWKVIPASHHHRKQISTQLSEVTSVLVYGAIMIALLQGFVGGVGFLIFGLGSPVLWGLVMALVSLIPFGGTAFVWLPAGAYLVVINAMDSDWGGVARGIGLLIYGTLIISTVDNLVRPRLVSSKARIHPVLVLVGVLGGLSVFGFIGMFLGPLVLALAITIGRIYLKNIDSAHSVNSTGSADCSSGKAGSEKPGQGKFGR